jgi:hypothetical protein
MLTLDFFAISLKGRFLADQKVWKWGMKNELSQKINIFRADFLDCEALTVNLLANVFSLFTSSRQITLKDIVC